MLDNNIIAETDRIYLNRMLTSDASDAYALNSDPLVMQHTGDQPFADEEEARKFLVNYSDYERHGMGRWAVRLKDDHRFIGWCGLKMHANEEVDLGYRFLRERWNLGYATEASRLCLRIGFEQFDLPYIIGRVVPQNLASIKVLQKIGMTYWKEITCEAHDALCFRIDKSTWKNAN